MKFINKIKLSKRLSALLLIIFISSLAAGCGSGKNTIDTDDPQKAFDIAKRKYDKREYVDAIDDLSFIKIRFPGTDVSDKVQYYLAASYYYQKEYILAAYEFESFVKNFQLSPLMPDAKYMLGNTYYALSPKYSLDQQFTQEAINQYLSFIETYPQDKNVPDAEKRINELRNKLAYKNYWTAELYVKTDNYKAATLYYQAVIDDFQESDWYDDALIGQAEAYINGRRFDDAKKVLDKYYKVFPNGKLKSKADRLNSKINELKESK